jgi:hypothetical protein
MLAPYFKYLISKRELQELPEPQDPFELRKLVEEQNPMPKCTCDICDPDIYRLV